MAVYHDTKCKYCGHNIVRADVLDSCFSDNYYCHVTNGYSVIVNDKMCDAIYYGVTCIEKGCECSNPQPRVS